jgi:preprotein translocase subunit SecF
MHFPLQLFKTPPSFDFIGKRWIGFALTGIGVIITIISLCMNGLNFGIDFAGGIVVEAKTEATADIAKMRTLLTDPTFGDPLLQSVGAGDVVMIRIGAAEGEQQAAIVTKLRDVLDNGYGAPITYQRVDYVGPQVGRELVVGSVQALAFALIAIMLYLWFRFEWQYGVGGILALFHDAILTVGFFSITGLEFNLTSVAAVLTIVGYSINDSVVIYDRVRENLRKYKKMPITNVINLSINETLARTFMTVGTVIAALLGLLFFGGDVLHGFSAAMLFGCVIGTYSSVYISVPVLIYLGLRPDSVSTK